MQSVVRSLGGDPAMDACDAEAVARGLRRQSGAALVTPLPWQGVVQAVEQHGSEALARLTPDGHVPSLALALGADLCDALRSEGLAPEDLLGRLARGTGSLRADTPERVAVRVPGRHALRVGP